MGVERTALVSGLLLLLASAVTAAERTIADDPLASVDPRIGTGGHGHTYPGATVPFGMVQVSPDTYNEGWDWCSGYHRSDGSIMGFSHTHLSGTGAADLLDVLLMPTLGPLKLEPGTREQPETGYRARFSHDDETALPGYYAVRLATGIRVELTATERVGLQRYTFPASEAAHVVLDLAHMIGGEGGRVLDAELRIVDDTTIAGWRRVSRWAQDRHVAFVARFSKPFASFGLAVGDERRPGAREAHGTRLKAWVDYRTSAGEAVVVRVALSPTGVEGAGRNLEAEAPRPDFDGARAVASAAWRQALSAIVIEGATPQQRRVFTTALYHAFLAPTLFDDVDGGYRGLDGQVHRAQGFHYHSTFSLWDTYRAAHPLYCLVQRGRVRDFVRSLLAMAEQSPQHTLPVWPLANGETYCMIGYHSISVIAEAWAKGIRDFDLAQALRLLKLQLAQAGYRGLGEYARLGYVPSDREGESVSKTFEYSYDDWAGARIARALGLADEERELLRRAGSYRNLLDPETGFARPRLSDGRFAGPFDPAGYGVSKQWHDYTEGNAWQYTWAAQHDPAGYVRHFGGRAALAARLDALFSTPLDPAAAADLPPDVSGLIGQYAHGNEPSHHVAYLYAWAGAPWKTQERVRQILDTLYADTPEGLAGNEDCGQMSAWYVLSALGLYPVDPAGAFYVVGSPLFAKATVDLGDGRRLVVRAQGASAQNKYVQSATLGGRPLTRAWVRHDELVSAGEIAFVMGPQPNRDWGASPADRPPAMSDPRE
jgi:predicted alpha-1,2-mannosidase